MLKFSLLGLISADCSTLVYYISADFLPEQRLVIEPIAVKVVSFRNQIKLNLLLTYCPSCLCGTGQQIRAQATPILIFFRSLLTFSCGRKSSPAAPGIIPSQHSELCKTFTNFWAKMQIKFHEHFFQWLSISLGVVHSQSSFSGSHSCALRKSLQQFCELKQRPWDG